MKLPDIQQLKDPSALIAAIGEYIDEAQQLVTTRETVSLAGLDAAVAVLCQRVQALTPLERQHYHVQFEQLTQQLSQLEQSMTAAKDEVAQALMSVNTQRKANLAYSMSKAKNKDAS